MPPDRASALLTDSYHLKMAQAYLDHGMTDTAVFEFFVRDLPANRNFLVCAGLEQALDYLENLRFLPEEIRWLNHTGEYQQGFLDYLDSFRFRGAVSAMPEGTVFFADEPVFQVVAPLPEAQLVETRLINILQYQILIASKAARCTLVSRGKSLVDFGCRRAHGADAGLLAARASFLAGFEGTSVVLAGHRFGIPVFGTMAHSFIEAQDTETQGFERFAESNPESVTLLIDTYDTEAGAAAAVRAARSLASKGIRVQAVRLDSGDLFRHSQAVRRILDDGGLRSARIIASGGIDEYAIHELLLKGAPIDGFGVGTSLATSEDAPYLDCAYKLEEYGGVPRFKLSPGKATLPGAKQVFRKVDERGCPKSDVIGLKEEPMPGVSLLHTVMRRGHRTLAAEPLRGIRDRCMRHLAALSTELRSIINPASYSVTCSPRLAALARHASGRTAA